MDEILKAIRARRSIRGFKPDPVPGRVLEELLETCLWAPSGSNMQPWEFAILGGKTLEDFKTALVDKVKLEWDRERLAFHHINPDIPYPKRVSEPYLRRALDIRRRVDQHQFPPGTPGLQEKRAEYLLYGSRLYGAPNMILLYTEKSMCPGAIFDIGIMAQTIALAAPAYGLGTCMMLMPVFWTELVRRIVPLPESKALALVIVIGYPDESAAVNSFERSRDSLETFARWYDV